MSFSLPLILCLLRIGIGVFLLIISYLIMIYCLNILKMIAFEMSFYLNTL